MKTIAHGGNLRASSGREFPRSPRARGQSSARPRRPLSGSPQLPPNVPAASTAHAAGVGVPTASGAPRDAALAPAARRPGATRGGERRARSPGSRGRDTECGGWAGTPFRRRGLLRAASAVSPATPLLPGLAPAWGSPARPPDGAERGRGSQSRGRWRTVAPRRGDGTARLAAPGQQHPKRGRGRFPVGISVCVCGALTPPIAGTVLVLMATLGLFLVPSLLLAPAPSPSLAGGPSLGDRALGIRGAAARGSSLAAVRSRPLQLCACR